MELTKIHKLIERLLDKEDEKVKDFSYLLNLSNQLSREVPISDVIDEEIGDAVESIIRFWNKLDDDMGTPISEREPIKVYINTPGGSLHATLTMVDAIRMSKTPVYTINTGTAFSGGFFIFISGHMRYSYPHATFLFHEGSTGGGGPQDAGKFRNYASFYDKMLEQLKDLTIENTKITEEEYSKHKLDDWWIFPKEAMELGICDEIISEFIH
jgi:ATP-dependent Clp protease protease subunit